MPETLEALEKTAEEAQAKAKEAKQKAKEAAEAIFKEAQKLADEAAKSAAEAARADEEAAAKVEEAKNLLKQAEGDVPVDECFYSLTKWPNMDFAIKPHPSKDRGGEYSGEPGHHFQFKDGQYSTANADEIEFIEGHELFKSGVILKLDPKQEAKKKQLLESLTEKAKAIGYKLVKI